MNRQIIAEKVVQFIQDGINSENIFNISISGDCEMILAYFGIDFQHCSDIHGYVIKECRLRNLGILRSFILKSATKDQLVYLMRYIDDDIDDSAFEMDKTSDCSGKVFVATLMNPRVLEDPKYSNFDITVKDIHKGLKGGIEGTNNEPYLINEDLHLEDIPKKMLREIRNCKFLVADLTCQNQGVYYEAGYAAALGKSVIFTCYHNDKDNIHFDVNQTRTIFWKDSDDLREQLKDVISHNLLNVNN